MAGASPWIMETLPRKTLYGCPCGRVIEIVTQSSPPVKCVHCAFTYTRWDPEVTQSSPLWSAFIIVHGRIPGETQKSRSPLAYEVCWSLSIDVYPVRPRSHAVLWPMKCAGHCPLTYTRWPVPSAQLGNATAPASVPLHPNPLPSKRPPSPKDGPLLFLETISEIFSILRLCKSVLDVITPHF